jgi:hypothetical protein
VTGAEVALTTVQRVSAWVSHEGKYGERTSVNENPTPRLVANPKRIRIRTEADLRRNAQPATENGAAAGKR